MKKKVFIVFLSVITVLLGSCSYLSFRNLHIDDASIADSTFVDFISAISSRDCTKIKSLFSKQVQLNEINIDDSI